MGDNGYFTNIGNGVYFARLDDGNIKGSDDYHLKGLPDRIRGINDKDLRYIVLDFKNAKRFVSTDITELIQSDEVLKKVGAKLRLCDVGPKEKYPHKVLKMIGIENLDCIEICGSLDQTLAELSQQS